MHAQTPEGFRISTKILSPQLRACKLLRFVSQLVIPEMEIHLRPCCHSLAQSIILMGLQTTALLQTCSILGSNQARLSNGAIWPGNNLIRENLYLTLMTTSKIWLCFRRRTHLDNLQVTLPQFYCVFPKTMAVETLYCKVTILLCGIDSSLKAFPVITSFPSCRHILIKNSRTRWRSTQLRRIFET